MSKINQKFADFVKNSNVIRDFNYNKYIFYFLFQLKSKIEQFKININTNCLVLSQYPGAEVKGLGGLIAQYPKNFEILCFTNGSSLLEDYSPVESASIKKQQFKDVSKAARVKGSKIFDIDDKTLKNHYSTFKKIDVSEADYIFVPNVYDNNPDTLALLSHFRRLLGEKEYKENLKIIMFESDFALCTYDCSCDISSIIETKKRMIRIYYPEDKFPSIADRLVGINSFRAINQNQQYAEVFMSLDVSDFMKIPII